MNIVDTHVHFWDLSRSDMSYPWLSPGTPHPVLGNIDMIKSPLYDLEALWAECRFAGVTKAVHVEADAHSADALAEVRWVSEIAQHKSLPVCIIARARLGRDDAGEQVDALRGHPLVRGVRDFDAVRYFRDPDANLGFERGVELLAEAGLLLDLDCAWQEMVAARKMAESHGQLTVVLEHFGYPRARDPEYFEHWSKAIGELARAGNVYCKISGLGMTDRSWSIVSLRPWVQTCIDSFGPGRCVFGSNWPVDRIASSYDAAINAFRDLIGDCSADEQEALCSGTAEEIYRL